MDHSEKIHRQVHPRQNANIFSLLTFAYTGGLFAKGFRKDLEDHNLYDVINKCRSKECTDKLEQAYNNQTKIKEQGKKISIFKILWNLYGFRYMGLGLFHMFGRLLTSTMEPEAISQLVAYFTPGQTKMTFNDVIYYSGMLLGAKAFHAIYYQNYQVYLMELAIQIRISFCSLIYRKALKLSPQALEKTSLGNIVTVITNDVQQFDQCIQMFNDIWIAIIQIFVICYLIYQRIGVSCLVGIAMLLALIPFQAFMSKVIKNLRLKVAKKTDERLQRTQETLSTIKTVKMYTWEQVFADKIDEARFKELKTLFKTSYLKISLIVSSVAVGKFAFYGMITVCIYINNDLSAQDMFYIMKIFFTLRYSVGMALSMGFTKLGELLASLKRINRILQLEELPDFDDKPDDEPEINLRYVSVNLQKKEILKNINLKLESGLNIVTGQLGCGKSSLMKVILRDYPINDGEVRTRGRKSYASQDPWLFPSSIKQNILFGEKYDFGRYQQVISVCALEYDFRILEQGDETIVADRGMNLSKGQQARINLARAVYKDSDIYLIDDALTALDAKVQEHIFTHCIQGFLKGKCVVLITHNPQHIQLANKVVILQDGAVKFDGNQQNVSKGLLESIENIELETEEHLKEEEYEDSNETTKLIETIVPLIQRKQVYHENKKSGSIDFNLYIKYLKMGGMFLAVLMIILFGATSFVESLSEKTLSNWINQKANITSLKEKYIKNRTMDPESLDVKNTTKLFLNDTFNVSTSVIQEIDRLEILSSKLLNFYTILIVSYALLLFFKHYLILKVGFSASVNLHKKMIKTVLNATMSFFDTFFVGNILNRFSQDLNVVDEYLAIIMFRFIGELFHLAGAVGLILSVNWKFMVPVIILTLISTLIRSVYIRTSRSLRRLEAATRSPIVGHLNSTMEGLTTIRAYKAQDILKHEFDKHQDLYTSALFTSVCAQSAFSFIMEIITIAFVFTVIVRFLFFDTGTYAGDVGLTLTQAGILSRVIQGVLMAWSEVENSMTSVERAMEYTTVESENTTGREIENWPSKGEITYEGVSLKYTNSHEKVLKNISFTVKPKNKIGIVGRTGAGKSSIISTLYRLYNYDGNIFIDGVELKTISLKFLRQHISIIPQDPIMFSGTIRSNIDPLDEFTDEEIWKTLSKVQLDNSVPNLQTQVGDVNFSTGQRQLICLARAIIRKNKILVLDEATANMDPETEHIVQTIINENFSSYTVLVIAHRLDAILDCNKVMVVDRGEIVEFDNPKTLLENKNGVFSEMNRNVGMSSS